MKRILSLALITVMALSMLIGCSNKGTSSKTASGSATTTATTTSAAKKSNRTNVVVRSELAFSNLNPLMTVANANTYVFNQVYEPLTRTNDDSKLVPILATEWTMAKDAMSVTFKLRHGVKFHNGEEMKASDVVFSYTKAMESSFLGSYVNALKSVEAVDDYTVKMTLKRPSVSFLNFTNRISILNKKFYDEQGGKLQDKMCGTGPYQLVKADITSQIDLEAFKDYWGGAPSIQKASIRSVTDNSTAQVSFEAGEIDFMPAVLTSAYKTVEQSGKYNTQLVNCLHTMWIAVNNQKKPFDNKLVRQALTYATDRDTMIQAAQDGYAKPARMAADERMPGVDFSNCPTYKYDLNKAKELLTQAGYPNGIDFKKDFGYTMDMASGSVGEKMALVFQESLNKIGCKIELRASATLSNDISTGNYSIAPQGTLFEGFGGYLSTLYGTTGIGSNNQGRYSNPKVDELLAKADAELDDNARKQYFKQITEIVTDDCPLLCAYHKQIPYAWAKDLNAKPHVSPLFNYYISEWSWK